MGGHACELQFIRDLSDGDSLAPSSMSAFTHTTALQMLYHKPGFAKYFSVTHPVSKKVSGVIKRQSKVTGGLVETGVVVTVTLPSNDLILPDASTQLGTFNSPTSHSEEPSGTGTLSPPVLQMRRTRHREIK